MHLIVQQQKQIRSLSGHLATLATKIQQVSERVEQSKAAPLQTANFGGHGGR